MSYKNNPYNFVPEDKDVTDSTPSTEVARYADVAMFKAEPLKGAAGPSAYVLAMNPDPLGSIAAATLMYQGQVVTDLAQVTDEQRRHMFEQIQQTKLKAPLEFVNMHFLLENIHRGVTHQLVRQRTAVYAQESMRFAVKDGLAAATHLPPSLQQFNDPQVVAALDAKLADSAAAFAGLYSARLTDDERNFLDWREATQVIEEKYNAMVNRGMPAEDARGLTPTNIGTRVHYHTNLRNLMDTAGSRLCTQAQFEWRVLWAKIIPALRDFGARQRYFVRDEVTGNVVARSSAWQFEAIASLFRPACYLTGKCEFAAMDLDRACKIRDRVDANAAMGRKSSEWGEDYAEHRAGELIQIPAIHPAEWAADPAAARVKG